MGQGSRAGLAVRARQQVAGEVHGQPVRKRVRVEALMTNRYTTGSVLYPDGGYALR